MLESGVQGMLYNGRGEAISATILDSLDLKLGFQKASRPIEYKINTPPKTNMEPKNDGFEKEYPLLGVHFQVPC